MGFVFNPNRNLEISVVAKDDEGKEEEIVFVLRRPRVADIPLFAELGDNPPIEKVKSCLQQFVVGWRGIVDQQGNPIPLTEENFDALPAEVLYKLIFEFFPRVTSEAQAAVGGIQTNLSRDANKEAARL